MTTDYAHGWVHPKTLEQFRQQFEENDQALFDYMIAHLNRYCEERDTCRNQLTAANQTITNLEGEKDQLHLDLNMARAGYAPPATISNSADHPTDAVDFRSEKFPDPEKFNGTRSKLPGFITQLRMKLEVNHDRFRNEAAKVIYSVSRLEGKALDQVVPLVNAKPTAPFPSVQAYVSYLEASFGDPDPRGTARRELKLLKQGQGDFAGYYSQFLRIMAYLDYNESAKIDALTEGLSDELQDALSYRTDLPNDVNTFAAMLMKIDNQVRGRKVDKDIRTRMGRPMMPIEATAHPSHVPGGLVPMDLSALQARSSQRPPVEQRYTFINGQRKTSPAEKQWRRDNHLCMYCAGSGHTFEGCPSAKRTKGKNAYIAGALISPTPPSDTSAEITTNAQSVFH
ncbi:hypothetical protein K3495_g14825 [Podosphaera aphanis]|nr:hypothetical protein K3495_g14825 [Podosphaera aphanis]